MLFTIFKQKCYKREDRDAQKKTLQFYKNIKT